MLEAKPRATESAVAHSGTAPQQAPPRFGLTITKKIGIAVERNRIRRRMKEAIRQLQTDHAEPNVDYVLIARRAALDCDFKQLVHDLQDALHRVHSRTKSTARSSEKTGRATK
jgi:ribonuclease P protein component